MAVSLERAFVWTGGALFASSLALTAWLYAVVFGRQRPWTGSSTIAWDIGLFSLFALHHSLFARARIKAAMSSICPDRLLRSVYAWVASLLLIIVCLSWRDIGGQLYEINGWPIVLYAVIQLTGLWLIVQSVRAIDALELAGIRAVQTGSRLEPGQAGKPSQAGKAGKAGEKNAGADELQVAGVYRIVRHPLYLGWMLIVFGTSHLTGDRAAFAAVTSIYLIVAIPWEERSLQRTFGDQYVRYKQQVRWRVVPYVY